MGLFDFIFKKQTKSNTNTNSNSQNVVDSTHKMNKDSNRITNCDDANISKSIEAGVRLKNKIEQFMKDSSFDTLPDQLKETARLRAENPELSLTELGKMMQPPMSKAGVAHRLKKLEKMMQF